MDRILFFDTETSGLPASRNMPHADDRMPWVVQFAAVVCDATRIYHSANLVVSANGRTIDLEAVATHGFDVALCDEIGVNEPLIASVFVQLAASANMLVAHNIDFDLQMMKGVLHRSYGERAASFIEGLDHRRTLCTMRSSVNVCKIPPTDRMRAAGRFNFKSPRLEELYRFLFGEEMTDAHDAMADVLATRKCYFALMERGLLETATV